MSAIILSLPAGLGHPTICSDYRLKQPFGAAKMTRAGMAIGEFSRRAGGNIETIRYYERIGLLPLPDRRGRYRRYGTADVGRLIFIHRARALGFTLEEVRALLRLSEADRGTTCAEARDLAARHLSDVRTKISDLQSMERTLADAVRRCDAGEVQWCPLIGSLSAIA
jgi:MerR family mercuric resistance operon transcriptional regulator